MGASIIRVSRRSRRFNCRPRPACPCDDAVGACVAVTGVSPSPGDPFFFVDFSETVGCNTLPPLSGLFVTGLGGPFPVIGLEMNGFSQVVFSFDDPFLPGDYVLVVEAADSPIFGASGSVCPVEFPFTVGV